MKSRRLDVMLSSTSKDLPDHREKAEDAAHRAGFYVVKMENLPAMPQEEDAISVSMAMVEETEVYIGIFGLRYGYRPKDDRNPNDISITEMEYRRAKELEMPILIFLMDDEHPAPDTSGMTAIEGKKVTDTFYESDPRSEEKLDLLKKELKNNHIVGFFKSADDIRTLVLQSLYTPSLQEAAKAYAQRRAAEPTSDDDKMPSAPKATIPFPPNLYAYPPYSGQNALFVGRRQELHMLNDWAKPESQDPMLVLEAIGGMGKSALSWRWVQDNAVPFDGIFWYSFYEGGAIMGDCIRHALAYVTRRDPADLLNTSVTQMLAELVNVLKNGRFLIVLDGLERILVAYHRWNAAQMQDDEVEEGVHFRDCTYPRDNDILRQLAGCDPSRILITSRLMPAALTDAGENLDGVRHEELRGLSPDDARHLWSERGISWSDEGLLDGYISQFGRHSLLLKLLIDIIKKNRRSNNHFDTWYSQYGKDINLFQDVKAKRHHILEFAYEGLSPEARKLLSQMAALGNAIDIETLNVFNPYFDRPEAVKEPEEPYRIFGQSPEQYDERQSVYLEEKANYDAYLHEKEQYELSDEFKNAVALFDALLQDLEERGLIWWDQVSLQYDLHPVVRGYAFSQLSDAERPDTFDKIYDYFEQQERGNYDARFATYQEMQNLIVMYNALLGARKFDEAAKLFVTRMDSTLVYEGLGLYHKAYELLWPLILDGWSNLRLLSSKNLELELLNTVGEILSQMYRPTEALYVRSRLVEIDIGDSNIGGLIVSLLNFSVSLLETNNLVQTLRCIQYASQISEAVKYEEEKKFCNY